MPWYHRSLPWVCLLSVFLLFVSPLLVVLITPNAVKGGGVVRKHMLSSWLTYVET